ncbi:hypothetical protein [Faucicola atlantae]|uniref:Uncharacterized protein n=1 Tax=Faucicola atlantae TaxID=34059 RepID=A0A1B8QCZ2_9GAMM|nr:hypothetical protein [Moraxella atlantae]OBX79149.1 hypothetical protein A9306_09055 [Moraxella atlantae]
MTSGKIEKMGYDLILRTCQQLDNQEQQLEQQKDKIEAYRQILLSTLEQLPTEARIDIKGRDLLNILADDI